ncbi:MAG: hypothetical protein EA419_01530 [Wenzhouxiangella sp.]|nr:MAG: hypothetical protein EA419_01530 [Wenzhouxiangella sp.]
MEEGILGGILELIEQRPLLLVAAAFVFALLESLAIVGIFIPGIILLFLVGAAVGFDPRLFVACWLAAALGALLGDLASYVLGRQFRDRIPRLWPLSRRPEMLAAGQVMFARHGGKTVFIGRFIGPIRPVVPLLAGMLGLRGALFVAFAVPAAVLWAPLYLLPGMLFGASLELAAEFAGRLVVLLLIVVLGTWFVVWTTRVVYEFTARRSGWWLKALIRWVNRHPVAGRLIGDLLEPGRHQVLPIALLGLLMAASVLILVSLLIAAPLAQPTWDAERQVGGVAASLRSHFADPFFVALSLAGEMTVMALLAGLLAVLLVVRGRLNAAWHWTVAIAGGWLLAEMTAGLMGMLLPPAEGEPTLAEVPNRAFVLSTVVLGFFAVLLAKDLSARRRKWPYLATSAMLALVGFAHFYLGRANLTGLLAAFALGLGWLALVGIGYRRRAQPRGRPALLALVFYGSYLAIAGFEIGSESERLLAATRLSQLERRIEQAEWRDGGWASLAQRRSRLGAYEQQRFDVQVLAELEVLRRALLDAGWSVVPAGSPADLLRARAPGSEQGVPPHLPRDFAGRPEDLLMVLAMADDQRILLRLWDSGTRIESSAQPLWLAQVRPMQLEPALPGMQRWREIPGRRSMALARLVASLPDAKTQVVEGDLMLLSYLRSEPQPVRPAATAHPDAPPDP